MVIDYPRDDNERIPITLSMPEGATVAVRIASTSERRMGEAALDDVTDTGVAALASRELVIAWVGTIGERGYELALADGLEKLTISPRPRPGCDLARHTYAVVLRFASDVVSPDLTVDLRRPVILDS